jgi:hypothetical protein
MTATPQEAMAARLVAGQIGGRPVHLGSDDESTPRYEIRGASWAIALEVTQAAIEAVEEPPAGPVGDPTPVRPTTRIWPFRLRPARRPGTATGSAAQRAVTAAVERAALDGAGTLTRARGVKGRHLFVWITGVTGAAPSDPFSSDPPFDGPELAPGINVAWVAPWEDGALPSALWCASPDWELPKEVVLGEEPQ